MKEIEIKLALAPEDVAAFRRAAALSGKVARPRQMTNLYFDTPARELAGHGIALRLRRSGRQWLQTLKGASSGAGGLHARGEWEYPQGGPVIDLSLFSQTPLGGLDDAGHLHERLAPAFSVDFERETWTVEPAPGSRLEVVLDRGSARAGDGAEALCEVEIEVLEGPAGAAFDLARALVQAVPMRPSVVTKAQRGYRLLSGAAREPARAQPVALDAGLAVPEAARAVIASALAHLQGNEEGVLETRRPEFVHQARVALRRLRTALRLFRPVLPPGEVAGWNTALGDVAGALGHARDWDVFVGETLPPLLAAFGDAALARSLRARARARQRREREALRPVLGSSAYAMAILGIAHWLASEPPAGDAGDEPLVDFASRRIRKRHHRLLASALGLEGFGALERHKLRVDAKRLRYGIEGLAALFPRKRVERYLEPLVALQTALGESNDAATAPALLAHLDPPAHFADFARGWLAARARGDAHHPVALAGQLREAKRFWRRKPRPTEGAA